MKITVTRIGNSRGIRIPKPILDELELDDEVELDVEGDHLIVRPARHARKGWSEAFGKMKARGDDTLIDVPATEWDKSEWEW